MFFIKEKKIENHVFSVLLHPVIPAKQRPQSMNWSMIFRGGKKEKEFQSIISTVQMPFVGFVILLHHFNHA